MEIQLIQVIGNQQERLFAAVRSFPFRGRHLFVYLASRLVEGFGEHGYILVRSFYSVERRFLCIAHGVRLSGRAL